MKPPASIEEQRALDRIGSSVYDLSDAQRQGLSASECRNIVTDLGGTILAEIRAAVLVERQRCTTIAKCAKEAIGADGAAQA